MSEKRTLSDWLTHLEALHPKGIDGIALGLHRVKQASALLHQTPFCPLILVGGTNGKGSTCAYLEAIYTQAGYKTGLYTSPHLMDYRERVRVGSKMVDDAALCLAFARVEAACQQANFSLTYFEFSTLAAWEVFASEKVDVMILEVGLGGRLDAVNLYEPDLSIITGIALDHQDWLGNTREAIGFEKAGIMRAGKPVLCGDAHPPASLIDHAQTIDANLKIITQDFDVQKEGETAWHLKTDQRLIENLPMPALSGEHQFSNAALAAYAAHSLSHRLPVSHEALSSGLKTAYLRGRFEIVGNEPLTVLDVAHNPQSMTAFKNQLLSLPQRGKTHLVLGMLADKDIESAMIEIAPAVDLWYVSSLSVPRGADKNRLASAIFAISPQAKLLRFETPEAAFLAAKSAVAKDDKIAACGSFYTITALLRLLSL